jgi:hypothetical protein
MDNISNEILNHNLELLEFIGENSDFVEYVEYIPKAKSQIINQTLIYKDKSIESCAKICATYGSNEYAINITDELLSYFADGSNLTIRKENRFNDFFGDPHFGVVKDLIINIGSDRTVVINENHNRYYRINMLNAQVDEFVHDHDLEASAKIEIETPCNIPTTIIVI